MGPPSQVSLEHVRVRGTRVDAAVARLRASHLLASAHLQPAAMPPSAVLVVRAMADPLPGRIAGDLDSAAVASSDWEHAARDRLAALYARAARPAWGAIPSSAEAVLFADYAELLACLAHDLSSGAAGGWWWRAILKRSAPRLPGSWPAIWEDHARYVPSAFELLSKQNRASAVLERIAPVQAWRLLLAVARAFELPASAISPAGPAAFRQADARVPQPSADPLAASPSADGPPVSAVPHPKPPWEPLVPSRLIGAALGTEKSALLGVALLLCRAPAFARTEMFASRMRAWLASGGQVSRENETPPSGQVRNRRTPSLTPPPREQAAPSPGPQTPASQRSRPAFDPVAPAKTPHATATRAPSPEYPARPRLESPHDWETGVDTGAGGIFYLIHLVRQLDLLTHFETGLSGWALLDLLARTLIGPAFPAFASDPCWDALAALDGREPHLPPGLDFQPQTTYAAPDSWLRRLGPQKPLARFRSRGVELWRPEGFLILASQSPLSPARSAEATPFPRELRRRFRRAVEIRPAAIPLSRGLRRFLHFVLPYARWRLANTLRGIHLEEVLARRGRLILTSTHIDLVMDMRQISVPVRLSGLDANPGWLPELGRIVTFHFLPGGFGGD